jgi:formylglycine-generating enzyme required for sulfatase activity
MPPSTLSDLLSLWKEAYLQGRDVPPADLCPDRPEMAEELARCIGVLRLLVQTLPGNGNVGAGTQPAAPAAPAPSRALPQVPGYEIEGILGRGGMGVVYRARHLTLGRIVALKMLLAGAHAGPEDLARFRTEAEAAARLQHANIVAVFEVGVHDGLPFCALELCPGGSLADRLRGEPLLPRQAAEVAQKLAGAIHYAHQQGVIHRDLKPHNILLAPASGLLSSDASGSGGSTALADLVPKVADFGLAKKLDDTGQTASGAILGTPSYMAPEQAQGQTKKVAPAADVYSLGAILYECLTGRPPFRAATKLDTLLQVIGDEPIPPSRLAPKTPRDLETICLKCLQKDPARRYPSALALADDLRRFLEHEPILARPVGRVERGLKWVRRNPAVAALLGLVIAVTVLGFALVTYQRNEAVAALQREEKARGERALAQVNALTTAAPPAVPGILERLAEDRADVLPRLRELWQEPDTPGNHARRMRVALALLPVEPEAVREELAEWMLRVEEPAEMLLVRDALRPQRVKLGKRLWARLGKSEGRARLRLLVALAAFDPQSPRWRTEGQRVLTPLLSVNQLHLGLWAQALRPVRRALLAPLGEVFRGQRLPGRREVATTLLADYARDDLAVLVDLLCDADPKQYAALLPLVQKQRTRAVALLQTEMAGTARPDWGDATLDGKWLEPEPKLVQQVEEADGLVAERFALCQTLPLERFVAVAEGLRLASYRPLRVRPYPTAKGLRVAALWARDGRDWRMVTGADAKVVRQRDRELRAEGFVPLDVTAYLLAGGRRHAALWVRAAKGEQARLYVDVPAAEHAEAFAPLRKAEYAPRTIQEWALRGEPGRFSAVWSNRGRDVIAVLRSERPSFRGENLDKVAVDVRLAPRSDALARVGPELLGWLAFAPSGGLTGAPWQGVWLRANAVLLPEWYGVVWRADPSREDVRLAGLAPAAHQARWRDLLARSYRPVALGVVALPNPQGERLLGASAWQRPVVPNGVRDRLASRQANAACALALLGRPQTLWPLLRHQPDPQLRSYLIDRLGPLGIDPRNVLARLEREQDVSARRALVLSLGQFSERQLPQARRRAWEERLLGWYRDEADAGLHGALDWLLRQRWKQSKVLERIGRKLAGVKRQGRVKGADPTWFVNGQGQTFTRITGPVEFLMGSPGHEADRIAVSEKLHRRRIGRSYALASKPVTVRQFQAFLKAHPTVRHDPANVKKYSPDSDGPMISMTWFLAAQYCRWLSEQEGVPESQMCYPPIEVIEKSKDGLTPLKLPPDYLRRKGYRLPTEAEWEYACRAGAVTSRSYGSDAALLDRYSWYSANAADRTWPVGQKLPNDYGLFDTHGNVWTWCQDIAFVYPPNFGGKPAEDVGDKRDVSDRFSRALRGASFDSRALLARCATRNYNRPSYLAGSVGVRPARTCD